MKHSINLLLWKHNKNESGLKSIYLRVVIDGKEAYVSTGYLIPPGLWDAGNERVKPSHMQADIINADITDRKARLMQLVVGYQLRGEVITASQIKQQFTAKAPQNNIFDFIDQLRQNSAGKRQPATLENYRKYAANLEDFHRSRELTFEEIDVDFLQRYENHLRDNLSGNYIHAIWTGLRTFFNAAKKKGIIKHYPFDQYDNPQYVAPGKEYLSLSELQQLRNFYTVTNRELYKQIIAWFIFGCYSGLRISDWFLFDLNKNIVGERIRLRADKNNVWVAMPISDGLKKAIELIKTIPLTTTEPVINRELKLICKYARIKKSVSSHCARHTFAVTMCAERGISLETCATLMGITVQTCYENYYKVTGMKIEKECLKAWKGV